MKRKTFVAVLCLLALPAWGLAQSFLLQGPPAAKARITLRYYWPQQGSYGSQGLPLFTGLYDLAASVRVGGRLNLIAAVPYMNYRRTYHSWYRGDVTESSHGLGNVSVGLQYLQQETREKSTSYTVGIYLPTLTTGKDRDYAYEHMLEACYMADYAEFPKMIQFTTLFARAAHYRDMESGWHYGFEGGSSILLPRSRDYVAMVFINYGAQAGRRFGPLDLKAELAGSTHVLGFVDEVYIRLIHQAALGIEWCRGPVRPGIFYSLFLDRCFREENTGSIGFRLQVEL